MKTFILFYKGPATPPGASHEKWPAWFNKLGDKLIDRGSAMKNGLVLHSDGSTSNAPGDLTLNGYSIVQAENVDDMIGVAKDHPFLSLGTGEYTIEIFELPG